MNYLVLRVVRKRYVKRYVMLDISVGTWRSSPFRWASFELVWRHSGEDRLLSGSTFVVFAACLTYISERRKPHALRFVISLVVPMLRCRMYCPCFFLKYAIFLCGLVLVSPLFFAAASSLASRSENGHLLLLPVSLVTDYSSPSCCEWLDLIGDPMMMLAYGWYDKHSFAKNWMYGWQWHRV